MREEHGDRELHSRRLVDELERVHRGHGVPALGEEVVVGAEPLNILFYLASLVLIFRLGREVFNRRAGLLAAGAVALYEHRRRATV